MRRIFYRRNVRARSEFWRGKRRRRNAQSRRTPIFRFIFLASRLSKILKLTSDPIGGRTIAELLDRSVLNERKSFRFSFEENFPFSFPTLLSFGKSPRLESSSFETTTFDESEASGVPLTLFESFESIRESIPESFWFWSLNSLFFRFKLGRRFFFCCFSSSCRTSSSETTSTTNKFFRNLFAEFSSSTNISKSDRRLAEFCLSSKSLASYQRNSGSQLQIVRSSCWSQKTNPTTSNLFSSVD